MEFIVEKLEKLKALAQVEHNECEDRWYSCPKSEDGCLDDRYEKNDCNCGADTHNELVSKLVNEIIDWL